MQLKSRTWMAASLLSLLVLGSSIPFANADAFDAGKTADAIYQAAQQSSVQQHQATPSQPATSTPSTGSSSAGNSGYSGGSNSGYSGGSSYSGDSSSGLSDNSGDDDDDDGGPKMGCDATTKSVMASVAMARQDGSTWCTEPETVVTRHEDTLH